MNKTEDNLFIRYHSALTNVPLPAGNGGTQSASVVGFVTYGKDMQVIMPALTRVFGFIRYKEFDRADRQLKAVEAWIKLREQQQFQDVFPMPSLRPFDEEFDAY